MKVTVNGSWRISRKEETNRSPLNLLVTTCVPRLMKIYSLSAVISLLSFHLPIPITVLDHHTIRGSGNYYTYLIGERVPESTSSSVSSADEELFLFIFIWSEKDSDYCSLTN